MASYDVSNLFTNVPLTETINIILDELFTSPSSTFLGLTRNLFRTFLELAVTNSFFFLFNGRLYKQVEGLGMGLPAAPTFSNIFMSYHEKKILNSCPTAFAPVFYRRYVDDTFVLFRNKQHAQLFFDHINSHHQSLKFTMEIEQNNRLPFLDVLVEKINGKFQLSVYRKPTNTGLGISFFSYCPMKYKINSIKTLISRAYKICSSYPLLHILNLIC